MIKIILLCLFFINISANDIFKEEKILIDSSKSLTIKDILEKKDKFEKIQKYNLGFTKDVTWLHLHLKNTKNEILLKRFYSKTSGLDLVDVFIVKDKHIIKNYKLGDFRKHKNRDNHFRIQYFDQRFMPNENIDIFIRTLTRANMDIKWHIKGISEFNSYYSVQGMIYAFIFGILSLATLVSFVLFLLLKSKYYLIYCIFTLSSILYQSTTMGFFYQFHTPIYLNTIFGYSLPILAMISLGLFPLYFFSIKKDEFKIMRVLLKISISILSIFCIVMLFYPLDLNILYYAKYYVLIYLLLILTLLTLSIRLFIAKKENSTNFLIANLLLLFFIFTYIGTILGFLKPTILFNYLLAMGAISQDIFLGFTLIYANYLIKKKEEKNTELLNEYSKLSFIGQSMINISHQWKTPINNIYSSINHIEIAQEFNDKDLNKIINKNLKRIKETSLYLKETAYNQLDFYKRKENIEEVMVYEEIKYVINLIENEFSKKSIHIKLNCDDKLSIKIEKNYFLNIIMILLENSFKIFEKRKTQKPYISIEVNKIKDQIKIIYKDNAGGLDKQSLSKIFDKDYSSNESTGIGLYLAKEIIIHKLKGNISVENTPEGLSFKLLI